MPKEPMVCDFPFTLTLIAAAWPGKKVGSIKLSEKIYPKGIEYATYHLFLRSNSHRHAPPLSQAPLQVPRALS